MQSLERKKVLVTGGAGFIGSHLVDALIGQGCQVRVLDNLSNGKLDNLAGHKNNKQLDFIQGSITDDKTVNAAVSGVDMIFHLACLGVRHSLKYPFENHRVNAEGTLLLLQAACQNKIKKFIYCSSSEIYGTAQFVPMPETHPINPSTVYGASKFVGEAYTRAYHETHGLDTVVIRPFNTYGPRSHHEGESGEMLPKSIVRSLNNKDIMIFGDGSQTRDFTYVEDTVRGFIEVGRNDQISGQTLNIGSNFEISIKKIAEIILEKMKESTSKIVLEQKRPGDVLRLYADPSRFIKITGWTPQVSFDQGLVKTIEWFKSRPEGPAALLKQEVALNWL
jgi:UDP-glucose 4-epimerase